MNPVTIRQRWPEARFVGIARADGVLAAGMGLGWYGLGPDIWGIVVETGAEQQGTMVPVTLRDGTNGTAVIVGGVEQVGTLPDVLAQAHYWELPAVYREQLQRVIDSDKR
jgi:hypothetical protein